MRQRPIPLRRSTPDESDLLYREGHLQGLRHVTPPEVPEGTCLGLEAGNKKTGRTGSLYRTMFVWNLPSVATCPGASPWCLRYCYNADPRSDIFPLERWIQNWAWVRRRPDELTERILQQLSEADRPTGVRIHSSGDFYSAEYVAFWLGITRSAKDVHFWAYTRSWAVADLRESLEQLRLQHNVQLFASWDSTMLPAPAGWRTSFVLEHERGQVDASDRGAYLRCPEETANGPACASCGYCLKDQTGGVVFVAH